jgi:hypothetical protein
MAINIVTNFQIINKVKTSIHFRTSLGLVATVDKNGHRKYNDNDSFSAYYNKGYNTIIYAQGKIGDIRFYTDHYIKDPVMAVYYGDNFEEFIFDWNEELFRSKGMDFYVGSILKDVETQYEEKIKNDELKKIEEKPKGNADAIFQNPGGVTYEDLQAYLEKKRQERYNGI